MKISKLSGRIAVTAGLAALAVFANAQETTASKASSSPEKSPLLEGQAAHGDWKTDAPGVRRKITMEKLPAPYHTKSVDNGPKQVKQPEGARPKVPAGFKVEKFAEKLKGPRIIVTAPNGDFFVTESRSNTLKVLRDADNDGKPEATEIFTKKLNLPFGIAFYPPGPNPEFVYVANTDSIVRFPYKNGQLTSDAEPEVVVANVDGGGQLRGGGHWTRDIVFSEDGKKMYLSIGSKSNVDDADYEARRARIFEYTPDGKNERVFATGIRNAVGIDINPVTKELWCSVNERDGLGDDLVPDYISSVKDGGFYGWPWYYIGPNQDPRHEGKKPELKDKVIVPDVLLQSHTASLGMTFYKSDTFPKEYKNGIFAAQHGSWNRATRTGYKVIFVPFDSNGKAKGEYVDFLTGFVTEDGNVWGRPVGVTVAKDGSLLVTEDGNGTIWRVSYNK